MKNTLTNIFTWIHDLWVSHPIFTRAFHAFWQAALAVILIGLSPIVEAITSGDFNRAWILALALVVAAVSAGLSALKGFIKTSISNWSNK